MTPRQPTSTSASRHGATAGIDGRSTHDVQGPVPDDHRRAGRDAATGAQAARPTPRHGPNPDAAVSPNSPQEAGEGRNAIVRGYRPPGPARRARPVGPQINAPGRLVGLRSW